MITTYKQQLEEKNAMEKELKRRCMIFQYEEKMYVARFFDIEPKLMEEISFKSWKKIQKEFESFQEKANEYYHNSDKYNPAISMGHIWSDYIKTHPITYNQTLSEILKLIKVNN